MEEQHPLFHRYRRDRRILLQFLLSSSVSASSSLSDADFDTLSADYVIDCVKSGGAVDIAEATKKYIHESSYPATIHSKSGDSFMLRTDPESSGSPPRRPPPSLMDVRRMSTTNASSSFRKVGSFKVESAERNGGDNSFKYRASPSSRPKPVERFKIVSLGLPSLKAGLSDDDLRESAYEILLASMATSGIVICSFEDQRKHKTSKLLTGLKSRKWDKPNLQAQPFDKDIQLLHTIRVQMQISEAMDECTRQKIMMLSPGKTRVQIDIPQIVLGLLNFTFKSDFSNEKSYRHWKNRQGSILEELLCYSPDLVAHDHLTINRSLAMIRNAKEWDCMSTSGRADVLSAIKKVALTLSSLPRRFSLQSETYYWTSGYHLNVRLYEKLLLGVFDVLDEGELIAEADEYWMLLKLTWSTLGITQKMHDTMYSWVLFQQFVGTDEALLLEIATVEVLKIISAKVDENVRLYMKSLPCTIHYNALEIKLSLVDAVFYSISIWCESKLQDYHLHFTKHHSHLKRVMSLVSAVGVPSFGDSGRMKLRRFNLNADAAEILESYVKRSIEAAHRRVASNIDHLSEVENQHPLAVFANELRLIAERELNVFYPELCKWCPNSGMIAAMMLHQVYWERLKPFMDGVPSLSEDVKVVLPAADLLDHVLTQLYNTGNRENSEDLHHYPIGEISKPLILDWVIAQHDRILEWTGRAFNLEKWEPLSSQQKQAASVVEVFRILEETVDQLFGFRLPMDITHLQALVSALFHALDAYLLKLLNQIVEKKYLYPSAPPLTRYKETTTIPVLKRKFIECMPLDSNVHEKLNNLTISKLCVRMNTLKYIQKQIDILEDGIRSSWILVRQSSDKNCAEEKQFGTSTCNDQIDELFNTTFDIVRDTVANAISKICDFSGAKTVFWDLRHEFLFGLYCGSVETSRVDGVLTRIDAVLGNVCNFIDESLRDAVVFSICQASMEGFAWVLLDGGPSRAFCYSDIVLLEDDLSALKEFFVADNEGLPQSVVQKESKIPEKILNLYSLQTETIIQKLMAASEQISSGRDSHDHNYSRLNNAHTFVRVLCHKKDREASKFLKRHYQLPMSSEYEETPSTDPTSQSPLRSNLSNKSTSFRWNDTHTAFTHNTFTSFKKKLQEATSELRNVGW